MGRQKLTDLNCFGRHLPIEQAHRVTPFFAFFAMGEATKESPTARGQSQACSIALPPCLESCEGNTAMAIT